MLESNRGLALSVSRISLL